MVTWKVLHERLDLLVIVTEHHDQFIDAGTGQGDQLPVDQRHAA
jgi:hypothetical protein